MDLTILEEKNYILVLVRNMATGSQAVRQAGKKAVRYSGSQIVRHSGSQALR